MRFLLVNTDYPDFVRWLYAGRPGLADASYDEQLEARSSSLFGTSDFYSVNLRALGHEAEDVHANVEPLQRAWAREHGLAVPPAAKTSAQARGLRLARRLARLQPPTGWPEAILGEQIRRFRPDVLINLAADGIDPRVLAPLKPSIGLLVGQHGAVDIPHEGSLGVYDLMISNFPPTVDRLRAAGLNVVFHQLAFEPRVLDRLEGGPPVHEVTFVGTFFAGVHDGRRRLVEELCRGLDGMRVWAPSVDHLPESSPIRERYQGPAWGAAMYQVLRSSRVTVNAHGDIPPFAGNCRLFEATGIGTALVTDAKRNLEEIFDIGREVAVYDDVDSCAALVEALLADEPRRADLARAGMARTLSEHTFFHRAEELVELAERYGRRR